MNDAALTLIGTALIVAIPATISAVLTRRNGRKIEATHDAVKVANGVAEEPLGDYIHRRMHTWDGRFDVMTAYLKRIADKVDP